MTVTTSGDTGPGQAQGRGEAPPQRFDFDQAFSRNVGWVTELEQQLLRGKTVAIAGTGGVGGGHVLTLARLGVGGFKLADPDAFELANFNRQAGAMVSTLGRSKVETVAAMTRDINPTARISTFGAIDAANVSEFLDGADLYVDGLDFFVLPTRRLVFHRCAELGIPAVTAAPVGLGAAYLIFEPGGMSFDEYFGLTGPHDERHYVDFLLGLTPAALQFPALMDPTRVDLVNRRVPSTPAACQICSGIVATESLKLLLRRGRTRAAPWYHQFDPYTGRWASRRLWLGMRNPLMRVKRRVLLSRLERLGAAARPADPKTGRTPLERILEEARWAPSGDNRQPWRFSLREPREVTVELTSDAKDLYDWHGKPTLFAAGCLVENMRLAASQHGWGMRWSIVAKGPREHRLAVSFELDATVEPDPLSHFTRARAVDRRRYTRSPLTAEDKRALEAAAGPGLSIRWFESFGERLRATRLNVAATGVRMRMVEAFAVHKHVIDFDRRFPSYGIPAEGLGLDRLLVRTTAWSFASFARTRLLAQLGGLALPHLELDVLPGLWCAAHFALTRTSPRTGAPADDVRDGQALQRFWLTATRLGLAMQPSYAPLWIGSALGAGERVSEVPAVERRARKVHDALRRLLPLSDYGDAVLLGRIGRPQARPLMARATRLPLSDLITSPALSPAGDP